MVHLIAGNDPNNQVREVSVGVNGGIDVNIQDQTTAPIVAYFSLLESETLINANSEIDDSSITVLSSSGFVSGTYLSIFSPMSNRFYLGRVLGVVGNVISLDTPLDYDFKIGDFVTGGSTNMNVNGSVTPVIFGLRNTEETIGTTFDITRLIFSCLTDGTNDLSKFGDIVGGITKGIVFRHKNGVYTNIFNAKTNGDLVNLMYDFTVYSSTNPAQGQNGFSGRMTFAGQEKMGVVLRLPPGDDLQIIIQDDLTSLTNFRIIVEGHIVE